MNRNLLKGLALAVGLTAGGVVHAQATNALNQPSPAPVPISPLTGDVISASVPTFEFSVVSNADQYRVILRREANQNRGAFDFFNYRFSAGAATGGLNVTQDGTGVVACQSATLGDCSFTPTDVTLNDGDRLVWIVGSRNLGNGQTAWDFAPNQRFRHFLFAAPAQQLSANDLFQPRGNIIGDVGTDRPGNPGPIAFHWKNNSDASSFRLVMSTNPEGNLLLEETFPVSAARCETTSGLFDACTYMFDPQTVINNNADDFCWSIVPVNQRQPNPPSPGPGGVMACYAAE